MCRSAHPLLRMKRIFKTFIVALCLTAVACTDYQVDIDELNDRVDGLEKTQIANISQQIAAINKSLPQLENTDSELKTMISSMKKTIQEYNDVVIENETKLAELKTEIEAGIADLKSKIEASQSADKQEMLDALTAAKAEIEAQLAALQAEANSKFEQMNSSLEALQAKDDSIEARIADLKTFVNTELVSQKSWAEKTFATLEKQNEILGDIEDIKGDITNLQTSLTQLEERITNEYTEAINSAVATLEDKIAATANDITNAYKDAITKAKGEIKSAYEAKIASSIDELEKSLTRWVNEQLKGYYTIAETDNAIKILKDYTDGELTAQLAIINALKSVIGNTEEITKAETTIVNLINKNTSDIAQLKTDLSDAKAELKKGYEDAIAEAIKEGGKVDELIKKRVKELDDDLQGQIDGINTSLSTLSGKVSTNASNIETLQKNYSDLSKKLDAFINGRIQSITYIPTTEDGEHLSGMVDYDAYGHYELAFQIRPAEMAKEIKDLKQISAKKITYYTHEGRSYTQLFDNVIVSDFLVENDLLIVDFKASDIFYNDIKSKNMHFDYRRVALSVSVKDNTNSYYNVASEYIYLNSEHYFMNYTSSESKFNPFKFNLYNASNGTVGYTTRSHLECNFVDVNSKTTKLEVQFAQNEQYPNENMKTITFGQVGKKGEMYNLHDVQLATGVNAFSNCTNLESVDFGNGLKTNEVESFASMFLNCKSLKKVGMNNLNTSAVKYMTNMFAGCIALDTLNLRSFDTRALIDATNMFIGCSKLKMIDLRGWDVSKLTNLTGMFADSPNLKQVKIDWKKFSTDPITLYAAFRGTGLTKVDVDVPNIKIASTLQLFWKCKDLLTVDLSGKAIMTGNSMGQMFMDCEDLTSVNLSGWTVNVSEMNLASMFENCKDLKEIYLDKWILASNAKLDNIFKGCTSLKTIYLRESDGTTAGLIYEAIKKCGLTQEIYVSQNYPTAKTNK